MATVSTGTQTTVQDLHLPSGRSKSYSLTSAHSGRLRYANPEDLPSYPSLGLKKDDAAAGAAASLGWANARPVSLWTPEKNASAHRAATLANDHFRMPTTWQSERGDPSDGSKTAAVLAAENASSSSSSRPDKRASMPASVWGNSAANQAFAAAAGGSAAGAAGSERVEPREPMTSLNRQKSLRAAREAVAGSGRPRSKSNPLGYPDSENAAANALSAATIAHRPTINITMDHAGAQPLTTMGREMYTSNPPVKPEVDEKNREAVLHASAVAMAKRMYTHQQMTVDKARQAHGQLEAGSSRPGSSGTDGAQQHPMQFTNLQEAAYKLAQERLARLHDEHQRNREVADYYGTSPIASLSPGKRLTRLGKLRRRASSDGDVVGSLAEDDQHRSTQIRKQMSLFSSRLDEVDEVKRTRDREALLAAAQRNVKATMEGMDEKMYRQTGRVTPAKLNEWELKAHAAAQARSDARLASDMTGKVDLGAGQYMDREKVEEIAAKRVQPVLDEINEKAELERKRIVALREEQEKKRLEWEAERARNAEVKENLRKLKEEEKLRKDDMKQEAKAKKEEEKAAKAEEKRLAKDDKDKTRADAASFFDGAARESSDQPTDETLQHKHRLSRPFTPKIQTKTPPPPPPSQKTDAATFSPDTSPESATNSPSTRVKNWLKSRLHKPRAKSVSVIKQPSQGKADKTPGGFIGGHALTRLHADGTGSMTSLSEGPHSRASMHEVALAGRPISSAFTPLRNNRGAEEDGDKDGDNDNDGEEGMVVGESSGSRAAQFGAVSVGSRASREEQQEGPQDEEDLAAGGVGAREARARTRAGPSPGLDPLAMSPPRAIVDPARATPRSSGSPTRDSKFIENID